MTTAPLPPPRRKPSEWPRWDRESDYDRQDYRRSVAIGLAATIIFHLMLIYVVPWPDVTFHETIPDAPNPPMEVELVEVQEQPPERFVETNPAVIEEKPEDTQNFAAQDQVAAQMDTPDATADSEIPKVDGEFEDSQKIVTGDLFEENSPPPVPQGMPDAQPVEQQSEQPPQEQPAEMTNQEQPQEEMPVDPQEQAQPVQQPADGEAQELPQQEAPMMPEQEALEDEGTPSIEQAGEAETVPEKPVEEPKEETVVPAPAPRPQRQIEVKMEEVVTSNQQAQPGEPAPKARPRINFKVPPGPLMSNPVSSSRIGALAIDANFSEFGAYQQRMMEAISAQWNLLGRQFNYTSSDYGTKVVAEFILNQEGQVTDLKILFTSSSRPATLLVQDAILSRAPFGMWTKEMAAMLGQQQTIRITFFYR